MTHAALLSESREHLRAALHPLLAGATRVALLDFPAHSNVGDSAIWLGVLAALRAVGASMPVYTCDAETYERDRLAAVLGNGTILFTGGGSFGDLWERHLLFRERVVREFPGNRIVQLPESVHFETEASLSRAKRTFNAHEQVTILTRDARSFEFVKEHFAAYTTLVPDIAMSLGPLVKTGTSHCDTLWLKRADKEDRWQGEALPTANIMDWIAEPRSRLISWTDRIRRAGQQHEWARGAVHRALHTLRPRIALQRLQRGIATLSSGRVVVTDRLHGHIMCCLLSIPHVVLDNSYGKLHNYVAQWTHQSPIVRTAKTLEEARAAAQDLMAVHRG